MKKTLSLTIVLALVATLTAYTQSEDRTQWPTKLLHPDMPVYPAGKLKGWNRWSAGSDDLFIIIERTGKADLDKYLVMLSAAGFEKVQSDVYRKGLYEVRLQFNSSTILQISSSKHSTTGWPTGLLNGVPEVKKGTLTNVLEPTDEMPGYVQLYYINLSEADLNAWLAELKGAGFKLDGHSASKAKMALKGKTYKMLDIQAEDNGVNEWMIDFNYSDE